MIACGEYGGGCCWWFAERGDLGFFLLSYGLIGALCWGLEMVLLVEIVVVVRGDFHDLVPDNGALGGLPSMTRGIR